MYCSYAQSMERRLENIRQHHEMDKLNIIVRFIGELRTPSTRIKDEVCDKYISKLEKMDMEHKMEIRHLN
jgi:hypothetical protein